MEEEMCLIGFNADDDYKRLCGEVYLDSKGLMIFQCTLCEDKIFNGFEIYAQHIEEHKPREISNADEGVSADSFGQGIDSDDPCSEVFLQATYSESSDNGTGDEAETSKFDFDSNIKSKRKATTQTIVIESFTNKTLDVSFDSDASEAGNGDRNIEKTETVILKNKKQINKKNQNRNTSLKREADGNHRTETKEKQTEKENSSINPVGVRNVTKRKVYFEKQEFMKERKFECPICQSSFKNANTRDQHVKRHSNEKPFSCPECGKKFYSPSEVKVHHLHVHQKPESKFLCTLCGRAFVKAYLFKLHIKKHNNQKDYVCDICNKSFFDGGNLKKHMTRHLTERPFSCEFCDSTFKFKQHLTLHLKQHENKREYKCQYCGAAYNIHTTLKSHIKAKHGH